MRLIDELFFFRGVYLALLKLACLVGGDLLLTIIIDEVAFIAVLRGSTRIVFHTAIFSLRVSSIVLLFVIASKALFRHLCVILAFFIGCRCAMTALHLRECALTTAELSFVACIPLLKHRRIRRVPIPIDSIRPTSSRSAFIESCPTTLR